VPRRILVIVNPAAGRAARSAARLRRIVAELERLGCAVVIRRTGAPAEAERLAREAEAAFDLIVAAGGDGTVNEVVNGLAGSARPMAVLPLGTGNVLANVVGLPRRPEALARVIAAAPPQPIWPARIGDRLFVAMAGIGFDAEVVAALDHRLKRRVGKLAFALAILSCLRRYRRIELRVEVDGRAYRAASAIIVKGRCYAGRFVIAPEARLADPVLHVVLFHRAGRLVALSGIGAMILGLLPRLPGVSIIAARTVTVTADAADGEGRPLVPVQVDGEAGDPLPIAIEIGESPLFLVGAASLAPILPGTGLPAACLTQ
jgi:YegS/Rv2252/BmrU family lipid kinase